MFDLHLTSEQLAIRDSVRDFVNQEIKPIAVDLDRIDDFEARYPRKVLIEASRMGLRTLGVSQELGGGGADTLTRCIVTEEVAVGDAGIAATLDQSSSFGHDWFDRAMNDEQRERFLPQYLEDHEYHLAFAGHEPDTDLGWNYFQPLVPDTGYKTVARRDGSGDWVINGAKNYITNAGVAKLIAVQVRTDSTKLGPESISTILVPGDTPGLTRVEHDKVGRRLGSNAELIFEDCRVPAGNLLGQEGRGMGNPPRGWGRGAPRFQAMNLGIGRAAYEAALQFSKIRIQGGRPIIEHQAVGIALAEMVWRLEISRNAIWKSAWAVDHPDAYDDGSLPDLPLQAIAKIVTSEMVHRVTIMAMEIFGGMGVMRETPAQKYVRDALIFLHSEHTNDVARMRVGEVLAGYRRGASPTTNVENE